MVAVEWLLYLRARYYDPAAGIFSSCDPFEGVLTRPMSLNGYLYVEGNVPNITDPSGMIYELPSMWDSCSASFKFNHLISYDISINPNPCGEHRNNIAKAIEELYSRAMEQITNYCKLWEIYMGYPTVQPSGCDGAGTWQGHQQAMRDWKRDLRTHLRRFNNTGRDGCPDEDGNVNETANAWLNYPTDELVPADEAEREGETQELPPVLAYASQCPSFTIPVSMPWGATWCIPRFIYGFIIS